MQGVQGSPRARARIYAGDLGSELLTDFFLARKKTTMHTLHTLHKRCGSKSESVQGLKTTLHIPCTDNKTDRGDSYAGRNKATIAEMGKLVAQ